MLILSIPKHQKRENLMEQTVKVILLTFKLSEETFPDVFVN